MHNLYMAWCLCKYVWVASVCVRVISRSLCILDEVNITLPTFSKTKTIWMKVKYFFRRFFSVLQRSQHDADTTRTTVSGLTPASEVYSSAGQQDYVMGVWRWM